MSLGLDLSSSRAKVKRAGEHLDTLYRDVRASARDTELYKLITDFNPDTGWLEVRGRAQPGEVLLSVILGEFIHDLRSGLDYVVTALAGVSEAPLTRQHQFPICSTPKKFKSAAGSEQKPVGLVAGIRHGFALIESFQPFHASPGTEGALGLLQRLSNSDKHRTIAVYRPFPRRSTVRIDHDGVVIERWQPPSPLVWDPEGEFVMDRIRFAKPYPTKMDPQAEMELHLSFMDAAFPPDYPDALLFTLEQLGGLRNTVSFILDQVEAL